jgi:hypothetical protein
MFLRPVNGCRSWIKVLAVLLICLVVIRFFRRWFSVSSPKPNAEDDRFVFGVRDFDDREKAERCARRMMEFHQADHFERSVG